MIGRVLNKQTRKTKESNKEFILLTIDGSVVSTFLPHLINQIKNEININDTVEYEASKSGDYINLKSIKKINPDEVQEKIQLNTKKSTRALLLQSFDEVLEVIELLPEKHNKEELKYFTITDITNMAIAIFNKKQVKDE